MAQNNRRRIIAQFRSSSESSGTEDNPERRSDRPNEDRFILQTRLDLSSDDSYTSPEPDDLPQDFESAQETMRLHRHAYRKLERQFMTLNIGQTHLDDKYREDRHRWANQLERLRDAEDALEAEERELAAREAADKAREEAERAREEAIRQKEEAMREREEERESEWSEREGGLSEGDRADLVRKMEKLARRRNRSNAERDEAIRARDAAIAAHESANAKAADYKRRLGAKREQLRHANRQTNWKESEEAKSAIAKIKASTRDIFNVVKTISGPADPDAPTDDEVSEDEQQARKMFANLKCRGCGKALHNSGNRFRHERDVCKIFKAKFPREWREAMATKNE